MKGKSQPAFPVAPDEYHSDGVIMQCAQSWPGMSIRQYFAAKALNGLLANSDIIDCGTPAAIEGASNLAFAFADEMIKISEGE